MNNTHPIHNAINLRVTLYHNVKVTTANSIAANKIALQVNRPGLLAYRKARLDRLALVNSATEDIKAFGKFAISVVERDCDCVDSYYLQWFSSVEEYDQWVDGIGLWAEGPVRWKYISNEEASVFKPYSVDHIMNAYENGRGNLVDL